MALTQLNAQFLLVFLAELASGSTPNWGEVTYDATQVSSNVSGCRQPGPSVISSSRCLMKLQIFSPFRHHLFLEARHRPLPQHTLVCDTRLLMRLLHRMSVL